MTAPTNDPRGSRRRAMDEEIAAEPPLATPDLAPDTHPMPIEAHLSPRRRPRALAGVVENGLVRPLDPDVTLPEHARVIIVTSDDR